MNPGASSLYSIRQLKGLNRIGDVVIPANGQFPAFSTTGCINFIDTLMATAHPDDIRDFGWVLLVFSFLPAFMLKWLMDIMAYTDKMPSFLAALFRTLDIGIRGTVLSLYYSGYCHDTYNGPNSLAVIDYQVHCEPDQTH